MFFQKVWKPLFPKEEYANFQKRIIVLDLDLVPLGSPKIPFFYLPQKVQSMF